MNDKFKWIRLILVTLAFALLIIGIYSCEKYTYSPPTVNPVDSVHFQTDIQPIFTGKCVSCHNGNPLLDLRDGRSYTALTNGGFLNPPGGTSKLYSKMIESSHASRSNDVDKQKVLIWINQGALEN